MHEVGCLLRETARRIVVFQDFCLYLFLSLPTCVSLRRPRPNRSRRRYVQMRELLRKYSRDGGVGCIYLESDAGLGKSVLVTAFCQHPYGRAETSSSSMPTETFSGKNVFLAKIQVRMHITVNVVCARASRHRNGQESVKLGGCLMRFEIP